MKPQQVSEEAVRSLQALVLAGERYRQALSDHLGLGATETRALAYLTVHGARGQNELAADLGLSPSTSTALVDRLERHGIAERYPHPSDRRRTLVRLTAHGRALVRECRQWLLAGFANIAPTNLEPLARQLRSVAERLAERSAEMAQRGPAVLDAE